MTMPGEPPDMPGDDERPDTPVKKPADVIPMRPEFAQLAAGPRLQLNLHGNPRKNVANVLAMLTEHSAWRGVLAYDAFSDTHVATRAPPCRSTDAPASARSFPHEWTEADTVRAASWMCLEMPGFDVSPQVIDQAIVAAAERNVVHPVRDYLRSVKWDATLRLPTFLRDYFGADQSTHARQTFASEIGARFLIAAVARIMHPGIQADAMLVFEGEQETGKSTGIEALASKPWFADTGLRIGDKDSYQNLRAVWIYELAELASVKAAKDVERVKQFVSARSDRYRDSYGRRSRDHLRQCVFAGTTNESRYLVDRTGNRRFWTIRCVRPVDIAAIKRDRDQLWAEAVARFDSGERCYLDTPELRRLARDEQADRVLEDPWNAIVAAWLANSPSVPDGAGARSAVLVNEGVEPETILLGALAMRPGDTEHRHLTRLGYVMADLGYVVRRLRRGSGRPRLYFPPDAAPAEYPPPAGPPGPPTDPGSGNPLL